MNKTLVITVLAACLSAGGVSAQNARESFQEFRRNLHRDYQAFRSHILEQYADFLEGEWHPYEPLRSPGRYDSPKPAEAPVAPVSAAPMPDVTVPVTAVPEPVVMQTSPPQPALPAAPASTAAPSAMESFDFYGMTVAVPRVQFNILNRVASPQDAAAAWRSLDKGEARSALAAIKTKADSMGLNGYLTYRMIQAYAASKFRGADTGALTSLAHYMMANLGYDVRLAMVNGSTPALMIPFEQTVYACVYLTIDGRDYTVFAPDGVDMTRVRDIYTCTLPKGGDTGRAVDLRITGLNLPFRPYHYDITGGDLHLQGTLNANMFEMLYRYPQMPTEDFAASVLDADARRQLVEQVRAQLGGLDKVTAVNKLMQFFHHGLPYATDEVRHGFEKPYFVEETLFYDKCDCEDRAIAFTYLVWHALGLPSQLIAYPLHESAAVSVGDDAGVSGYNYSVNGRRYYSADPTYIGSSLGDVMPDFATTAPKIDKTYE